MKDDLGLNQLMCADEIECDNVLTYQMVQQRMEVWACVISARKRLDVICDSVQGKL
mgnify:FL=1